MLQRTLFDLLGPIIDPIGYQIELETYVANIMRGPANLYITLAGYLGSASVFFHFFVDPQQALTVSGLSWGNSRGNQGAGMQQQQAVHARRGEFWQCDVT